MLHLLAHCKLSCLQASQAFVVWSHLVTWSWVSPRVFWTRRHPSCMHACFIWSLSASVGFSSSIGWGWWASSSVKFVLSSSPWSTLSALCFSFMMFWEARKMSPSSMGCFEETISPSTSYREGFSWDMCLLISSMHVWKLSRSSKSSLKLGDWMPVCSKLEVWQFLSSKKLMLKQKREQEAASTKAVLPC